MVLINESDWKLSKLDLDIVKGVLNQGEKLELQYWEEIF